MSNDLLLVAIGTPVLVVLLSIWTIVAHLRARQARALSKECELRHSSLLESSDAGLALIDRDGRMIEWNERLPAVVGGLDTSAVGTAIAAYPWQDLARSLVEQAQRQAGEKPVETRIIGCDGAHRWVKLRSWPVRDGYGRTWLQITDVTRREETRIMLRLAQQAYRSMSEAVLITDATTRIVEVNPAFERLTGYRREEVIGMRPSLLRSEKHKPEFFERMWGCLSTEMHWAGELWNRCSDGTVVPCWMHIDGVRDPKSGEITHYVGVFSNISERKMLEDRISYLAHHDTLTGLANRLSLDAVLPQTLAIARRNRRRVALLFIDLDRFKAINDRLGHACGDAVLCEVARRLAASVRDSDFIARIGGDEFLVVLSDIVDADGALQVANAIIKSLEPAVPVDKERLSVTPSIGISLFPEDGDDPTVLIGRADLAMYRVKSAGRAGVQFHAPPQLH